MADWSKILSYGLGGIIPGQMASGNILGGLGGLALSDKAKGGAKKPPPFDTSAMGNDMTNVPQATSAFNQRLSPEERAALIQAMIARSRGGQMGG